MLVYQGVIMGFSGTRGKFELFQTAVMDYVETSTHVIKQLQEVSSF